MDEKPGSREHCGGNKYEVREEGTGEEELGEVVGGNGWGREDLEEGGGWRMGRGGGGKEGMWGGEKGMGGLGFTLSDPKSCVIKEYHTEWWFQIPSLFLSSLETLNLDFPYPKP